MSSGTITPESPRMKDSLVMNFVYYGLKESMFVKNLKYSLTGSTFFCCDILYQLPDDPPPPDEPPPPEKLEPPELQELLPEPPDPTVNPPMLARPLVFKSFWAFSYQSVRARINFAMGNPTT